MQVDLEDHPPEMGKKVVLYVHFKKHLDAIRNSSFLPIIDNSRQASVYVKRAVASKDALVFRLSSGVYQFSFKDKS